MRAVVCDTPGQPGSLAVKQVAAPLPAQGEVLVDIDYAGVNFPDLLLVQGLYQRRPDPPFIPGIEIAGRVAACGAGVSGLPPGTRVIGYCGTGGFAEQVCCDARRLLVLPDFIPAEQGAGLTVAWATAHYALTRRAALSAGEWLVVTGAGGGTGLAAVQIGKALGARVAAVCSTAAKREFALANGAEAVIDATADDLKGAIKALNDGHGADVAYDTVGGDIFDALSRAMAWDGRLLVIGFASGRIPQLPTNLALLKGYALVGAAWGAFVDRNPETWTEGLDVLYDWYRDGAVRVPVDDILPLEAAPEALNRLADRQVTGKLVLRCR
ncbi:MAG: NADPH:quinone oxidoreductase family protein [Gammaproteobacteria bacterium]|nr:NADPH:quinone oxidoreductase family protein [Gammaproteobacteria bacterium]